jgi:hypothetical protein
MNQTNTQKLFEAFPRLYRGRNLPPSKSSMLWGFECGDGWFDLVWNLSKAIEENARSEGLTPQSADWPEATQVKNKLGSLRFHLRNNTDATRVLREDALEASTHISDVPELASPKD